MALQQVAHRLFAFTARMRQHSTCRVPVNYALPCLAISSGGCSTMYKFAVSHHLTIHATTPCPTEGFHGSKGKTGKSAAPLS